MTEEKNLVPLVHYQPVPITVTANGHTYNFDLRFHVALCYVPEEDVPAVLSHKKKCCGGHVRPLFQGASQAQIRAWNGLGR